jgi:large conductance mechanosensitive channel
MMNKYVITPAILEPSIKASGAKDLEGWMVGAAKLGLFLSNIIFLMVRAMAKFKRKEEKIEASDTKECPYCLSTIPIAASKCSHCTSELPPTM